MGFLRRLGNSGPYTGSPRNLNISQNNALTKATYQIVPGLHGGHMAQLELTFGRVGYSVVTNPDMTLAVVLDRSGSMTETYRDGHVYNAAAAILNHVAPSGTGYDLVFYDTSPTFAGHIRTTADLQNALQRNYPSGGGTQVTAALRGAIKNYRTRRGIYMIVVTDGEFADKSQVQQFVESLLPQVTPENPYAYRLHFVGAGEEVDKEFLKQLESLAMGQGVPLVSQHHHAHLRHSHDSMFDEMDRAYTGCALDAVVGQAAGTPPFVTWVGDVTARRWHDGSSASIGFLPRRVVLGLEFAAPHPATLDVSITYGQAQHNPVELALQVPLPQEAVQQQAAAPAPPREHRFHLPWIHHSPDDEAARAAAAQQRDELARQSEAVRQAEIQRQAADLQALARGGIPTGAQQRLRELGQRADETGALFTSNLDPDETALLRRHGYRLRGMVTGSAMYHVGQA